MIQSAMATLPVASHARPPQRYSTAGFGDRDYTTINTRKHLTVDPQSVYSSPLKRTDSNQGAFRLWHRMLQNAVRLAWPEQLHC